MCTKARCVRHALVAAAAALAGSVAIGGGTPRPMLDLNPKKPQLHAGYQSVLFWRVRIEDRSGDLVGLEPRFVVGPTGSAERVRSGKVVTASPEEYFSTHYRPSAVQGRWERHGGQATYEGLFAVEARPGTVEFFQFALTSGRGGDLDRSAAMVPIGARVCAIAAGKLIYLGALSITVERVDPKDDRYRFVFEEGPDSLHGDLETVRTLFPVPLAALPADPDLTCAGFEAQDTSSTVTQ
jgi:hypothetical protein